MQTKFYIILGISVLVSFAGGFYIANSLNRAEIASLSANQKTAADTGPAPDTSSGTELSEKEIDAKLSEAAGNADDFLFQKGLGLALYRYAAFKGDGKRLEDVRVLLKRAHDLNPDDYQVLVALANVIFDLGQINKDDSLNAEARELYRKALKKNPKDAQVLGDLGTTYIESSAPEPRKALEFLDRSYESNKRNDKVVLQLTKAHLLLKDDAKANEYLMKLKTLNPQNPEIRRIEAQINAGGAE